MAYTKKEFVSKIDETLARVRETLISKGHDYTTNDPLENFKVLASHSISQKQVAMTMIGIKVNRLKNLLLAEKNPKFESVDDTVLDLICYGVLLDAILKEPVISTCSNVSVSPGLIMEPIE